MTPPAGRTGSKVDAFDWISLGVVASACVLWLALARTDPVVAFLFQVQPGQPILDRDLVFHRQLAVRAAGAAIAIGLAVAGVALRKRPLDGRSPFAWMNLVAKLVTLAAVMAIARDLRGRPMTYDFWIVFAGVAALLVAPFLRRRRGAGREQVARA
jgi:hypothetical protein